METTWATRLLNQRVECPATNSKTRSASFSLSVSRYRDLQRTGVSVRVGMEAELLCLSLAVLESPLTEFPRFRVNKRDLLNARVVIATYNQHIGSIGLRHRCTRGSGFFWP
jgi:hypothetical protein